MLARPTGADRQEIVLNRNVLRNGRKSDVGAVSFAVWIQSPDPGARAIEMYTPFLERLDVA